MRLQRIYLTENEDPSDLLYDAKTQADLEHIAQLALADPDQYDTVLGGLLFGGYPNRPPIAQGPIRDRVEAAHANTIDAMSRELTDMDDAGVPDREAATDLLARYERVKQRPAYAGIEFDTDGLADRIRYKLAGATDPDTLMRTDGVKSTFIYTQDGKLVHTAGTKMHASIMRQAGPGDKPGDSRDSQIHGRTAPGIVSIWNKDPEALHRLLPGCLKELISQGLAEPNDRLHSLLLPQPVPLQDAIAGRVEFGEPDSDTSDRWETARQLHTMRGDKKAAMKKLGLGGGGKVNRWNREIRKTGTPTGNTHHAMNSESRFSRQLNRVLGETFDSVVPYQQLRPNTYTFNVHGNQYHLEALPETLIAPHDDTWTVQACEIRFQLVSIPHSYEYNHDVRHTGNARTVLATVIEIVRQIVTEQRIQLISFTAEEPSRLKLYRTLANKLGNQYWKVEPGPVDIKLVDKKAADNQEEAELISTFQPE